MKNDKIGIITYTRSNNYGARLQAYAVYKIFKQLGYNTFIIDIDYPKRYFKYVLGRIINISSSPSEWLQKYLITFRMWKFNYKNFTKTKHFIASSTKKMVEFINKQGFVAVLCGSDEIWSSRTKEIAPPSIYFLPEEIKSMRFSMAPSSNGNHKFAEDEIGWLKMNMSTFVALGVRDKMTLKLMREVVGVDNAELIYDPTIYVEFPMVRLPRVLNRTSNKKKICFVLAKPNNDFGEKIISLLKKEEYEYYSIFNKVKGTHFLPISPEQFACIFREFDLVYTNLFHGTIFSLKEGANVIALDTFRKYQDTESKVYDLMKRLQIEEFFFSVIDKEDKYEQIIKLSKDLLNGKKKIDCQVALNEARNVISQYINKIEEALNENIS